MFRRSLLEVPAAGRTLCVDCVAGIESAASVTSYAEATSGWDEVAATVAAPSGAMNAQMIMNASSQ